uniref:Uncharacterized protein n=1 Tax=Gasterosteus aculeatus aculeatus TaxID=481459 RepID=A0AAQ4Q4R2_GASAC
PIDEGSPPPGEAELEPPPPLSVSFLLQIKVVKFSYTWTINNFSFCREVTFSFGLHPCDPYMSLFPYLRVRVNPKGPDEESKDYRLDSAVQKVKFLFSTPRERRPKACRFVQGKDWVDEDDGLLPDDKLTPFWEATADCVHMNSHHLLPLSLCLRLKIIPQNIHGARL